MSYLGQSTEFALQALNLALSIQDKKLIQETSLLLCDTIGQFDPISSIIYLALSQVWIKKRFEILLLFKYLNKIECKCFSLYRKCFKTSM